MSEDVETVDRLLAGEDRLLPPGEVARVFRVDPKTVTRWARAGRLDSVLTPGGRRRFLLSVVKKAYEAYQGSDVQRYEQRRGVAR